jgi:hypothetical protein
MADIPSGLRLIPPQETNLNNVKVVAFSPIDGTSLFQLLDQSMVRLFKYFCHKQFARKTISMIAH